MWLIDQSFHIDPVWLLVKVRTGLYLTLCISVFTIAFLKKIKLVELILLLSPWALMFELNDPMTVIRKDNLLIVAFLIYSLLSILIPIPTKSKALFPLGDWRFWYLLIILPVIALVHEGLFLFLQFFLLIGIVKKPRLSRHAYFALPYLISCCVLVASSVYSGTNEHATTICNGLTSRGLDKSICDGAIQALGGYDFNIMSQYRRMLILYLLLTFIPILCYMYALRKDKLRKIAIISVLLTLMPTVGLYFVAQDWGRWIHISAVLTFFH